MHETLTRLSQLILLLMVTLLSFSLYAHGVDEATKSFLTQNQGVAIFPFIYIGAKHMISGYDHLLFLIGVIFFLYKTRDVLLYVSLFTLGHSVTLLFGVLNNIEINAYLIDAIIGFSIVYKGLDNLGGIKRLCGFSPNQKMMVMIFGLFHGFGLATKIQEFNLPAHGLIANIIAFNIGVELGQFLALGLVLILISLWRRNDSYLKFSLLANSALVSAGLMLVGFQLTGFFIN